GSPAHHGGTPNQTPSGPAAGAHADAGRGRPTPALGSDAPPSFRDAGAPSPRPSPGHDAGAPSWEASMPAPQAVVRPAAAVVGHAWPEPQDAGARRADAGRETRADAPKVGVSAPDAGAAVVTPAFDASAAPGQWEHDAEIPVASPSDVP